MKLRFVLLLSLALFLCIFPIFLHLRSGYFSSLTLRHYCSYSDTQTLKHAIDFQKTEYTGNILQLSSSWNHLHQLRKSNALRIPLKLRVALFVKKWPFTTSAGGLERHALTLHRELARRGHEIHVFTTHGVVATKSDEQIREWEDADGLHFHVFPPNKRGRFDYLPAWQRFLYIHTGNDTSAATSHQHRRHAFFDVVHSESVALPPNRGRELSDLGVPVVASWHGIGYEIIHSDIVRELVRDSSVRPPELQRALTERVLRVVDEIKAFPGYGHHVATSDSVGEVLRTVYQLPSDRVHVILNGVDELAFRPDPRAGDGFRREWGIPPRGRALVLGAAGRLVKDKGYPLLFEAFSQLLTEMAVKSNGSAAAVKPNGTVIANGESDPAVNTNGLFLLIAGDGPWALRFKALSPENVLVLGSLSSSQLSDFYNAIDVFVNPTLRPQGLDHTLLEAMLCGKPLLATHFSSIVHSVIVSKELGYTFSPNLPSLVRALREVVRDGSHALELKGHVCYHRASLLFTASKMASAYERLFLCLTNEQYCAYP